jgi:hypothetical protein
MMLLPGCVSGSANSFSPAIGPIPHEPDVGADLPETDGDGADRAVSGDERVERRLGPEVVRGLADLEAGPLGQLGGHPLRVLGVGVDAGADRRPSERDGDQLGNSLAGPTDRLLGLPGVAEELLT